MIFRTAGATALVAIGLAPLAAQMPASSDPPASAYPPCAPGPGDDSCIQLYEPGVRQALAASHRGDATPAPRPGMGGPDEETAVEGAPGMAADAGGRPTGPVGTTVNDPVDAQGAGLIEDNARGIDADASDPPADPQ